MFNYLITLIKVAIQLFCILWLLGISLESQIGIIGDGEQKPRNYTQTTRVAVTLVASFFLTVMDVIDIAHELNGISLGTLALLISGPALILGKASLKPIDTDKTNKLHRWYEISIGLFNTIVSIVVVVHFFLTT